MVITVEPGIYVEEEGIGIRIEDDILVLTLARTGTHSAHSDLFDK